jgi:hypothetical protein
MRLSHYRHVFLQGILDSLSFHKTIPVLGDNAEAWYIVMKIFATNIGLVLGSKFLFERGITPLMQKLQSSVIEVTDIEPEHTTFYFLLQCLWLSPICLFFYGCCLRLYQQLADSIGKPSDHSYNLRSTDKKAKTKKVTPASFRNTTFALATWIFAFLQAESLTQVIPRMIDTVKKIEVDYIIRDYFFSFPFKETLILVLDAVLIGMRYLSLAGGLVLLALVHAWFAFAPTWNSTGLPARERFSILQKHILYFAGFGAPFVVLNRLPHFFIGFSIYLTVPPFAIILGSIVDYQKPYSREKHAPIKVFGMAQEWAHDALKMVGKEKQHLQHKFGARKQH